MSNIEEILNMLDRSNPPEIQKKGRSLAKEIRCINVFFRPAEAYGECVWENCARILAERTDEELRPYLKEMFDWIADMNWPGAQLIWDRLKHYQGLKAFDVLLDNCIIEAKALKEKIWLENLQEIKSVRNQVQTSRDSMSVLWDFPLEIPTKTKKKQDESFLQSYINAQDNVDVLLNMLDGSNPVNVQTEGRKLARQIKLTKVFVLPCGNYGKRVWENCARILAERTDEELRPYLKELFDWIADMNWPGAEFIWDRLKRYQNVQTFDETLSRCIVEAKALKEKIWLKNLKEIKKERKS